MERDKQTERDRERQRREERGERDSGGGVCRWARPRGYLVASNSRHFIQIIIMDLTQPVIIVNEHITIRLTLQCQCSVYKVEVPT